MRIWAKDTQNDLDSVAVTSDWGFLLLVRLKLLPCCLSLFSRYLDSLCISFTPIASSGPHDLLSQRILLPNICPSR